jgi:hypothetical protein
VGFASAAGKANESDAVGSRRSSKEKSEGMGCEEIKASKVRKLPNRGHPIVRQLPAVLCIIGGALGVLVGALLSAMIYERPRMGKSVLTSTAVAALIGGIGWIVGLKNSIAFSYFHCYA